MSGLTSLKKIVLGALLVTFITYECTQFYHSDERPRATETNFEMSLSVIELNKYLMSHTTNILRSYIDKLSPLQIEGIINQIGVGNLTSDDTQKQFLKCAGAARMLRSLPVHMPKSHQNCKNMSFQSSGPTVALGSFPGSGNSWVRQLLESATGIYTGALYCDGSYLAVGMMGEGVTTNNVIAVKTHGGTLATVSNINPDKGIYVVRSPFAAILSEHNRYLARKAKSSGDRHTTEVKQDYRSYANNTGWANSVKKISTKWKRLVSDWVSTKRYPVLVVGYDNLVKSTHAELRKMLDFIGYPYSEDDILCTVKSSGEAFHRSHTKKQYNPFSPEVQDFVLNNVIKDIDALLLKHNISLYHPYTI